MRRILFYIYLYLAVFNTKLLLASDNFNFVDLAYEEGDPPSYTLVCLDSRLIPASHKIDDLANKKNLTL